MVNYLFLLTSASVNVNTKFVCRKCVSLAVNDVQYTHVSIYMCIFSHSVFIYRYSMYIIQVHIVNGQFIYCSLWSSKPHSNDTKIQRWIKARQIIIQKQYISHKLIQPASGTWKKKHFKYIGEHIITSAYDFELLTIERFIYVCLFSFSFIFVFNYSILIFWIPSVIQIVVNEHCSIGRAFIIVRNVQKHFSRSQLLMIFHCCIIKTILNLFALMFSFDSIVFIFSACYRFHKLLNLPIQSGVDRKKTDIDSNTLTSHTYWVSFMHFLTKATVFSIGCSWKKDEKRATKCTVILLWAFSTYFVLSSHITNNTYLAGKRILETIQRSHLLLEHNKRNFSSLSQVTTDRRHTHTQTYTNT